ncbi:MAG TPA: Coq4 family protein [Chitinophagaceae bacterium]|nr:Coq4 family protein [Chitinophagaceae bacterium]
MKKILLRTRTAILVFLTHKIALPVLKIVRKPNPFTYNKDQLRSLPPGSLGNDLYYFLEKRNLPLLNHYTRHDLKHVLLGYDTTDDGEACLQSFMLGNGRISFPVLATVLYSFVTMPEHWKKMKHAYRLGRKGNSIHGWPWNELLKEPTAQLRNKIFNNA